MGNFIPHMKYLVFLQFTLLVATNLMTPILLILMNRCTLQCVSHVCPYHVTPIDDLFLKFFQKFTCFMKRFHLL